MNRISTVLLVSAAILVGLVLSVSAFAVVMPYGHMLFSVPWWGHMTGSGHMMGYHETTGYHHYDDQTPYDCSWSGYWSGHDGHHLMNGPGTTHHRGMTGDSYSTGGYGPMHGPGMMNGSAMMAGHGM